MSRALPGARVLDMITSRQIKAMARYHLRLARHLFIHIPKNAGMAVRNSPQMRRKVIFADPYFHVSRAYTRELVEVMTAEGFHHGAQHARLIDVHPAVRARLQPVAVIRNPYARVWSRFTFQMKYEEREGGDVDYSPAAFEAFLEERHIFAGRPYFWHRAISGWYPQTDYVIDESGALACHILRQEHLAEEIGRYFGVTDLPQRNRSGRTAPHYRDVYSDAAKRIVAEHYKADIELFGFDFEGPAQRNYHFGPELTQT
jgi:hypothetical protein